MSWRVVAISFPVLFAHGVLAQEGGEFFENRIRPVLVEHCQPCHGETQTAGLRLDSRAGVLKGGRSGSAVIPGDVERSLLWQVVSQTHGRIKMPPNRKLTEAQIEDFGKWIRLGAPWPEAAAKGGDFRITDQQRGFWAWQPLHAPRGATIDDLMTGIGRAAERRTLLRRVTFDLIGLPPTPEELDGFLADRSGTAYEKVVDRLLASPHFGERWGRFWLDVARYSEDDVLGLSQESYSNAWRYRDWVTEAFNKDLPYGLFIKAQIAGDLVEGDTGMDLRPALGFFGLGPWYYSIAPPPQARADERHDRVDVVTRGFLGLTVACARCHDHKFDPIPTKDYYALAGVFASSEYREIPLAPRGVVEAYERHQQKIRYQEKRIKDFVDTQSRLLAEALGSQIENYLTQRGPLDEATAERWKAYLSHPAHDHPFLRKSPAELQALALAVLAEKRDLDEENAMAVAMTQPKKGAAKTRLPNGFTTYDEFCPGCDVVAKSLERDRYMLWRDLFQPGNGILMYGEKDIERYLAGPMRDYLRSMQAEWKTLKESGPPPYPYLHALGEKARPVDLRVNLRGSPYSLGEEAPRQFLTILGGAPFKEGSGRLALAEQIGKQPIAMRVAVNRIWGQLMGRYLVGSPSNFGQMGGRPSNPELLEYLAQRFVEGKGSRKALIREIVLSRAYRAERHEHHRLDAEALRDAVLMVAGSLDLKIGGPSVDLSEDRTRRTMYGKVSRFRLNEVLELFDFPSPSITSEKRNVTLVPLQRLYFLNSPLVEESARKLAARLTGEDGEKVRQAYRLLFSRQPGADEMKLAVEFVRRNGWPAYAQVLLSSNEFCFVN